MNRRWISGALALNGCIYYHILKLDPENESVRCVGDDFGRGRNKCMGTVLCCDGCLYGIPDNSTRIIFFDPANHTSSILGDEARSDFRCNDGSVFGRNGCIYSLSYEHGTRKELKIDVVNNTYTLIGNEGYLPHNYWGEAVLGNGACMYWPPFEAKCTMKFDVETQTTSHLGHNFGVFDLKLFSGAVASTGAIYCIPNHADKVLRIDTFQEFATKLEADMKEHSEVLGFLFEINNMGMKL